MDRHITLRCGSGRGVHRCATTNPDGDNSQENTRHEERLDSRRIHSIEGLLRK